MDMEPSTPDVGPEKLARLWGIGSDAQAEPADGMADPDEQRAQRLRDWLARPLPPDEDLQEMLPEGLGQLCRKVRPFSGDTIGSLITDPNTDVQVLERIKDLAKEQGTVAENEIDHEVALAVYFAAIAGAAAFHDAKISQHSDAKLRKAFVSLTDRPWIPTNLRQLLKKACGHDRK